MYFMVRMPITVLSIWTPGADEMDVFEEGK